MQIYNIIWSPKLYSLSGLFCRCKFSQYNSVSWIIFGFESLLPAQIHVIIQVSELYWWRVSFCRCKFRNKLGLFAQLQLPLIHRLMRNVGKFSCLFVHRQLPLIHKLMWNVGKFPLWSLCTIAAFLVSFGRCQTPQQILCRIRLVRMPEGAKFINNYI